MIILHMAFILYLLQVAFRMNRPPDPVTSTARGPNCEPPVLSAVARNRAGMSRWRR
jgi:hypothetical protein